MTMQKNILTTLLLLLFAGVGMAQENLITNSGFENITDNAADSWTIAGGATGGAADDPSIGYPNNSSYAHGGSRYSNGGSSWGHATKTWRYTITQTGITLATKVYQLSFYYKLKGCTLKAELIGANETKVLTLNGVEGNESWTQLSNTVTITTAGTYTLVFTAEQTVDGQKYDYFQIDDVRLMDASADLRPSLQASLEVAAANYTSGTAVNWYLNQVIERYNQDEMTAALDNYSSLQNITLNTAYILNFLSLDNGRTIVFEGGASAESACTQAWMTATENQLWTLVGDNFDSFVLQNGNGLYFGDKKMVSDKASAVSFSLDYNDGTGIKAWELHKAGGSGNGYALNGASGVKAGNGISYWNHNDNGNAFRFVLPDNKNALTTSSVGSEVWYYLNFAEAGFTIEGVASGSQAVVRACTGSNAQQWALIGSNQSSFKLKNKDTGLYLKSDQTMGNEGEAQSFVLNISSNDMKSYEFLLGGNTGQGLNPSGGVYSTNLSKYNAGDYNNRLAPIPVSDGLYTLSNASNIDNESRKDVTVNRTIAAGWGTICLPFDVQVAQLKANFGNDVELYEYEEESDGALTFTRVNLSKYDNSGNEQQGKRDNRKILDAGKPYLIKASTTVTNPVFTQRVLSTTKNDVTDSSVAFKGNYESTLSSAGLYGVTTAGYILSGQSDVYFTPWMAYFETITPGVKLSLMIDGETTAIGELKSDGSIIEKGNRAIFDLSGRRVAKPQRGLYIVNGKKVIIK